MINLNFELITQDSLDQLVSAKEDLVFCIEDQERFDKAIQSLGISGFLQLGEYLSSENFTELKDFETLTINFPKNFSTEKIMLMKLPNVLDKKQLREVGGTIGGYLKKENSTVIIFHTKSEFLAEGIALRNYSFNQYKSSKDGEKAKEKIATILCLAANKSSTKFATLSCGVKGTFFTRDLVNEPSNVLTTTEFADRLLSLESLGVEVRIIEEDQLIEMGMNTLTAVGQASKNPSKVVIMEWKGGEGKPFAVLGKGVCFDTGGISIKPARGMEKMTMDMAGAGVVAGLMKAIALAKSKVNVVGVVGLVENMPGGNAMRPGDIVKSYKGDTVEILNTDAEGRLVLADLLWYTQEKFDPKWIINLATLTGAIMVSLGFEYAGLFSNHDLLTKKFMKSSKRTGERAWRQPLDKAYDKLLESRLADMQNIGGMYAGAITAAQFLQRFVKPSTPWIHLDIAGVAFPDKPGPLAPKGPSGWGVRTIFDLIHIQDGSLE